MKFPQGGASEQEHLFGLSDALASPVKPPMYAAQHYGGYGGPPHDASFLCPPVGGAHMGQQRTSGYPPMMRMPGVQGPRPGGVRPGGANPQLPPQPNNLRLQLQHRLQAQLVRKYIYIKSWPKETTQCPLS